MLMQFRLVIAAVDCDLASYHVAGRGLQNLGDGGTCRFQDLAGRLTLG